ncbi:hypothetical protein HanPI659440_Chr08g0304081 [Helianthus annuus]|nr:hypothetical protein HanPI659440_Chr08g0304081 [Helianthus annuus]
MLRSVAGLFLGIKVGCSGWQVGGRRIDAGESMPDMFGNFSFVLLFKVKYQIICW